MGKKNFDSIGQKTSLKKTLSAFGIGESSEDNDSAETDETYIIQEEENELEFDFPIPEEIEEIKEVVVYCPKLRSTILKSIKPFEKF